MRRTLVESISAALRSWFPLRPPQPRPRQRLTFQALEPRLLLSADLMPADGVLQIMGTEADDSVLIREVDGAALEVVLNDRALRFDLGGISAVQVDLLGGHDRLEVDVGTAIDWAIDLGSGNDLVALELTHVVQQDDTAPPAKIDFAILAGAGVDAVIVDATGAFAEFDLSVDLGPDAAANEIAVETLTLSFEEIRVDYRALSRHSYQADGESDGAAARYEVTLRSDGDSVQAAHEAETVGGLVSDQVDIQVGGSRTESIGSLATIDVGSRSDTVDHKETITIHGNHTEVVGADVLVAIHGVDNLGTASAVSIALGGAQPIAVAKIFEDNARTTGVLSKTEVLTGDGEDRVEVSVEETATAPIITGAGAGGAPQVKVFKGELTGIEPGFLAYPASFTGGVRVASGDVNGDGTADIITGAGPGGGPHVKVFDGRSGAELASFFAYDPAFAGGVFVAAGDVNGDGRDDIITGADAGGGPHVKVFDGATLQELRSFFAYAPSFTGGVRVAAGDVNGDGFDDVVTGTGAGGPAHVKVFDGQTGGELRGFLAYDPGFAGGVFVAAGDVNGDGRDDIVTGADAGGGPHVKVFDALTLAEERSFFAYTPSFTGGVRVATGDVNGDGLADIITGAGPGAGPQVKVFDARSGTELQSFFAYDPGFSGGVYVVTGVSHPAGPAALDLAIDAGDGDDAIDIYFNPKELTIDKPVPWQVSIDGGAGIDALGVETGDVAVTARIMAISGFKMELDVIEHPVASFDMAGLEAFALQTGSGDDQILIDIDRPSAPLPALSFSTGAGDDVVKGKVNTAGSQGGGGIFNAGVVMGTGSDRVDLRVVHSGDARSSLAIELGGADAGRPESGDEVLVVFENADPRQPVVIGTLWSSQDAPGEEQKSLRFDMASAGRTLDWSAELHGGSGEDHVQLSFEGKLKVARDAASLRGFFDLGGGEDSFLVDLSALKIAGRTATAPIQITALVGAGEREAPSRNFADWALPVQADPDARARGPRGR